MNPCLYAVLEPAGQIDFLGLAVGVVVYLLFGLLPFIAGLYLAYFLLTLPLRRNERARLFLDLLELGLGGGRSPEHIIADVAASRDRGLGARFHLLAAYIEQGLRFDEALDQVPRLLPPQIRAMLRTGQRIGDLRKVLPACRLSLHGSISQVRGALNYVLILAFLATPFTVVVPIMLRIKVVPAFKAVFTDAFGSGQLPAFTRFVLAGDSWFIFTQAIVLALVWVAALGYVGGPRLRGWLARILPGGPRFSDWILAKLPWRRKRLQRDFSAMLATLLEAGVPEIEAVQLAGESTANTFFQERSAKVAQLLAQGIKLPEAVRELDNSGELQWRCANALRGSGSFVRTLAGWHEALDAKAFQLEQTAAQVATTILVLFNGWVVACIVIGMFLPLIELLNRATLW